VDAVITMFAEHKASPEDWPYTFSIRLGNAILSFARYIGKAFWPAHLAYLYPHPGYSLRWGQVWAALFLVIAVSALVIAQRRQRYLVVGWFWFLGTMVPLIGLVQIDVPALADRWAYIGFVGLFLMICWAVAEWAENQHWPKVVLPVTSLAVLMLLAGMTHRQIRYWSDSFALWTHTLEVTHRNWIAETNLGTLLRRYGQPEEASAHFYRAAEEEPGNAEVNWNVAVWSMSVETLGRPFDTMKKCWRYRRTIARMNRYGPTWDTPTAPWEIMPGPGSVTWQPRAFTNSHPCRRVASSTGRAIGGATLVRLSMSKFIPGSPS
jgi:hypothetical protein